ncbi:VOC family protein [Picosynechococcus sp. NKBG15041c]|uniref:VOC family protein n=1 Tax=Picosynechococcus sp. NKBG15041c TaxID=1407650 RepID=UPI0004285EB9|nr:VOC family protein [Picosynechococcus sp. NKBG15041c]
MLNFSDIFVTIAAESWSEVVVFYRGLFGCDPVVYSSERYAEFRVQGVKLGIFKPSAHHRAEFQKPAGALGLCLEVENLEEAIATIKQLGGAVQGEITQASHGRECYAYDPARNRLILHQAWADKA